jgi:hypothetical protein
VLFFYNFAVESSGDAGFRVRCCDAERPAGGGGEINYVKVVHKQTSTAIAVDYGFTVKKTVNQESCF